MQFIIGNVAFKLILRFKLRYEILKKTKQNPYDVPKTILV